MADEVRGLVKLRRLGLSSGRGARTDRH